MRSNQGCNIIMGTKALSIQLSQFVVLKLVCGLTFLHCKEIEQMNDKIWNESHCFRNHRISLI